MNDLNSVLIEGNLTKDPNSANVTNGSTVCNFSVATHYTMKSGGEQRQEISFFDVEAWGKVGENCYEYLSKGRGVRIVGRLKQDRWKNGDGQSQSRVKIVAQHVDFRSRPRAGGKPNASSDKEKHDVAV